MYYRVGPIRCRILSAGVQPIRALLVHCRSMSRVEAARILGIEPNSSKKDIKKAYIKQAKIYHPDSKTGCETKFRQLQTASDVLHKLEKIPNTKTQHREQEIDPDEILNKFYQKRGFHNKAEYDFYRGEAARAQRRAKAARNSSRYAYDIHEARQKRNGWNPNQKFIWTFWNAFIFTSVIYFVFSSNPEGRMFNRVCGKLIERLKFVAATHDISVAMVLNDFISYANRRRSSLKYLTNQEFRFLYSVFDNANPKCKEFILENPDIVYYKYKKDG